MSRSTVVIELAEDAQFVRDLSAGGVFVPGCTLALAEECDLVVCGANHQLRLAARVVYVEAHRGAGLELVGFSADLKAQLAELEPVAQDAEPAGPDLVFVDEVVSDEPALDERAESDALFDAELALSGPVESAALIDLEALHDPGLDDAARFDDSGPPTVEQAAVFDDELALAIEDDGAADIGEYDRHVADAVDTKAYPIVSSDAAISLLHLLEADTLPPENAVGRDDPDDLDAATEDGDGGDGAQGSGRTRMARNAHERLRGLNLAAQIKLAVSGEQHERIVLERLYGKNVWEALLRNPRLTAPEVARIARYGSLPRVLLEIILNNGAWLQIPEVRRALLANPRLGTDQIVKVLRLTPKHELKLAAVQTAYPHAVRNAAKMLLRSE